MTRSKEGMSAKLQDELRPHGFMRMQYVEHKLTPVVQRVGANLYLYGHILIQSSFVSWILESYRKMTLSKRKSGDKLSYIGHSNGHDTHDTSRIFSSRYDAVHSKPI